jgi:hypothetical protein
MTEQPVRQKAEKLTETFLKELRQAGDPLADEAVAEVYQRGERVAVNELWRHLLQNDSLPPRDTWPELVRFLKGSARLPEWMDPDKVRVGEALFMEHGLFALVALLCASLPECYVMRNGVQVLWATQRLEAHVYRRLFETAQMVVAVMSDGGLSPQGSGVIAAQKVRLMHAAIRHLILHPPEKEAAPAGHGNGGRAFSHMKWDQEKLGYPINQEDMVYTLLTFSYVIPRAMLRLGVPLTEEQQDAFLHCWNVVGYVMGVREDLLPADVAEAGALFSRIQQSQAGSCQAGRDLTAALVRCIEEQLPEGWMRRLPRMTVRHLVGKETAAILGLPRMSLLERVLASLLWVLERVAGRLWRWLVGRASRHIGEALVQWITTIPRGWQRELFDLPDHLAESWDVRKPSNQG